MKPQRSLNALLTVITILLAMNLWTAWTADSTPRLTSEAQAAGIPNPGAQRYEMIRELKTMNKKLDELTKLLTTGKAKVTVTD